MLKKGVGKRGRYDGPRYAIHFVYAIQCVCAIHYSYIIDHTSQMLTDQLFVSNNL